MNTAENAGLKRKQVIKAEGNLTMNKHLKIGTLAILLASVGVVSTASAFGRSGGGENAPTFEELDANGDGIISLEELEGQSDARFDEMDTDGDGFLSVDEITAMIEAQAAERAAKGVERMIERFDEDEDGVISADEMPSPDHSRLIDHADEDEDGSISEDEFEAAKEKREERGGKRGGKGGKGGKGHGDRG